MNATQRRRPRIRLMWEEIEEEDTDISTEQLLRRVADQASSEFGVDIDESEVAEAVAP